MQYECLLGSRVRRLDTGIDEDLFILFVLCGGSGERSEAPGRSNTCTQSKQSLM